MPRRKTYYKKRRGRRGRRINKIPRTIIPYKVVRTLPYQTDVVIVPGANLTPGHKVFTLNGLYDPDISGGGHQPRGFDQYCGLEDSNAFYRHYVVLGVKATVHFAMSSDAGIGRVGMQVRDSVNLPLKPTDYLESANQRSTKLSPLSSGGGVRTLTMKWSAKQWFGKPNVTTERDLQGSSATNPGEQAYLHVWCDGNGTSNLPTIRADVRLSYLVMFKSPIVPAES